jgi:hypothetical protein
MTQSAPTRILNGVVLPAPGIWKVESPAVRT